MWCYLRAVCVILSLFSFLQELQQQLMIETRNLKKTRNFYQKLLQQERKNKGTHIITVWESFRPTCLPFAL